MEIEIKLKIESAEDMRRVTNAFAILAGDEIEKEPADKKAPKKSAKKATENEPDPLANTAVTAEKEVDPLGDLTGESKSPPAKQYTIADCQQVIKEKLQKSEAHGVTMKKILTNLGAQSALELTAEGCNAFMEQVAKL